MSETAMAREPESRAGPPPVPPAARMTPLLRANTLDKTYRMGRVDVRVLKGASLDVRAGEWIAILGPSGSGKSTLLHLMGDLDRPDKTSGPLAFEGRDLNTMSRSERNDYRNQTAGFVFQFYHLLPELNVLENTMLAGLVTPSLRSVMYWLMVMGVGLLLGLAAAAITLRLATLPALAGGVQIALILGSGAIGAFAATAGWTEIRSLLLRFSPERAQLKKRAVGLLTSFGLEHRLKHRPRELSGGERQRVAIARALINNPRILLADEPTGNLDVKTGAEIMDLIAEQHRKGLTIVMVTHDTAIAERADRVVHLDDGRIAETG